MNIDGDKVHETLGVYEAKTRLSELLDRVAAGKVVVITRHGIPVARLVPPAEESVDLVQVARTLTELRELGARVGFDLSSDELRGAIEEGRK
jgi:prevent-host-death family protein